MLLFSVILGSSLTGLVTTWWLTGGFAGGGNPVASLLIAFAIALLWARSFNRMERLFFAGEFDKVRQRLRLWKGSIGEVDAYLLRLRIALEERVPESRLQTLLADAAGAGVENFARAWAAGWRARLERQSGQAMEAFMAGAEERTFGLDRAELYCEAGRLLLQVGSDPEAGVREDDIDLASQLANRVRQLVRQHGQGGGKRQKYVHLLQRSLRGLIYLRQERWADARRILDELAARAGHHASLRARRLGREVAIDNLLVVQQLDGMGAFSRERTKLAGLNVPSLRLRLAEVEAEVKQYEDEVAEQAREAETRRSEPHELFGDMAEDDPVLSRTPEGERLAAPGLSAGELATADPTDEDEQLSLGELDEEAP